MWNLVYKDLFMQKKGLIFAVIYCIFILFTSKNSEPYIQQLFYLNAALIMIYILQFLSLGKEEKNETDFFLNSLPLRRIDIVSATYLYGIALTVIILAIFSVGALVFNSIFCPVQLMDLHAVLIVFLLSTVLSSIYIPIYLKLKNVQVVKVILFAFVFFVLYSVPAISTDLLKNQDSYLIQNLTGIANNTGEWLIWAIAILAVAFIALVSWAISLKIYMNKDF